MNRHFINHPSERIAILSIDRLLCLIHRSWKGVIHYALVSSIPAFIIAQDPNTNKCLITEYSISDEAFGGRDRVSTISEHKVSCQFTG